MAYHGRSRKTEEDRNIMGFLVESLNTKDNHGIMEEYRGITWNITTLWAACWCHWIQWTIMEYREISRNGGEYHDITGCLVVSLNRTHLHGISRNNKE